MAQPEVWLRGQMVPGVPALLQPVAHSLLQCREEVDAHVSGLTPDQIWTRPGGAASVGFHVRHAIGSLDRLLTYARGEQLSAEQLHYLANEAQADVSADISRRLVAEFDRAVEGALDQFRMTAETALLEGRVVGRGQLPSTVVGLLFHAAEHTQRHAGQLVTTTKVLRALVSEA